jgi:hypothetical protein
MADQKIIDKYLKEFHEVQKMKVPIELNIYLHRMIDEALSIHDVSGSFRNDKEHLCWANADFNNKCFICGKENCR